jgi:CubicO group peptidase (beta-lactamase class C family)
MPFITASAFESVSAHRRNGAAAGWILLSLGALAGCVTPPPATPTPAPPSPIIVTMPTVTDVARRLADTLRTVLDRAVLDSAFPGAIAVVGTSDRTLATVASGHLDWAEATVPDEHTLWDLASLTKVVGTTSAMIQLVADRRVELDAPVQRYVPSWKVPGADRVTIRHLLLHTSGLRAHRPLYTETNDAAAARALVYATPLDTVPGARTVYSDLGIILLGDVIERVTGERLEEYLNRTVFGPLGMTETMYRPPPSLLPRIAPTEVDPWRGRHIRGEVHDENAFRLGGVAPHAGLFSSAHDLARFARMYLNSGRLDSVRVLDSATIALFTRVADKSFSTRALGWDTPDGRNSAGTLMSDRAFGHTGFTGTSIWIDPSADVFVLLLTNRVNPSRANMRIAGVRRAVADAAMSVMRSLPPSSSSPP